MPSQLAGVSGRGLLNEVQKSKPHDSYRGMWVTLRNSCVFFYSNLSLRGGIRDGGPFSVMNIPRLSAKASMAERHFKQSQAQRDQTMELAREKTRKALQLAQQVGAAVRGTEGTSPGPDLPYAQADCSQKDPHLQDEAVPRLKDAEAGKETPSVSSAIIPKGCATYLLNAATGETKEDQWDRGPLHVYMQEDTGWSAFLDPPSARPGGRGLSVVTCPLAPRVPYSDSPPCRDIVLYLPRASTCRTGAESGGAVERVCERVSVVPEDEQGSRFEEIVEEDGAEDQINGNQDLFSAPPAPPFAFDDEERGIRAISCGPTRESCASEPASTTARWSSTLVASPRVDTSCQQDVQVIASLPGDPSGDRGVEATEAEENMDMTE